MRKSLIAFGILLLLFLAGCQQQEEQPIKSNPSSKTEFLMGTVVTVKIYDEGKEDVLEPVFERIQTLADQISVNDLAPSVIDEINANAGKAPVKVPDDLLNLLETGKAYSDRSDGSFDITVGPLTSLWRIGFPDAKKPTQTEIDQVLPLINYQNVTINTEDQTIFLQEPGMQLDLGAIAKGFITDEIIELLKENDVQSAIVDLGGNIYVLGKNASGKNWTVGVQDPFSPRGEILGKMKVSNKSVVTSGIYERYLEVEGEKYHHLLNPQDGYPFDNDLAGVSVITDKSIDGDALSTVLFSKGLEEGLKYAGELDNVEAIFVSKEKEVYMTSGLMENFELTNESYQLAS